MYLVFDVCAEHTKQSVEQLFGEFLIRQAGLAFDVTAFSPVISCFGIRQPPRYKELFNSNYLSAQLVHKGFKGPLPVAWSTCLLYGLCTEGLMPQK